MTKSIRAQSHWLNAKHSATADGTAHSRGELLPMDGCVICELVKKAVPAWIVYEDTDVICFLPLEMEAFGHTLIAPKSHYADLFSAPPDVLSCVLSVVQKVSLHYRTVLGAAGVNVLHASGVAAQQSVLHLHVHLLPRFAYDGLDAWPTLSRTEQNKDALLQKIRF